MATGIVKAAIIKKIKEAIKDFVFVPGVAQSIQKQLGKVGATEAGIKHSDIINVEHNDMKGVGYYITNDVCTEKHMLVKNGARLEYYIETKHNDVSKKNDVELIFTTQMPQKTPEGGDGASGSN